MIIESMEQLDDLLSEPTEYVVETLSRLEGDIILLGAGGKIGPSLARMAKRASDTAGTSRRVIGVDLFPSGEQERKLQSVGVETLRCDLLNPNEVRALPDAANVVFMAGMKFGSTGREALTWAINAYLPGLICEKYRNSRIVVFSTGNIYGMTPVSRGGSVETDVPRPEGEYAMSALGRERIFEYFSCSFGMPAAIIRLNYACEMRYGVLLDIARRVFSEEPVDLAMGYANVIWQGDANAMVLAAFGHASSPPLALNVTGPEVLSVREVAERFGSLVGKKPTFAGEECPDALLSNTQKAYGLFGRPSITAERMITWIAEWVMRGGESLGKPTHFESRDGRF